MKTSKKNILACWESLLKKFSCLKKMAIALLAAFQASYLCEEIFSQIKFILSAHRSRFTEDQSKLCVQLSVSKFSPNITELNKEKQKQGICSFIKKSLLTILDLIQ